jgi:hypothetical protein
MHLRGVGLLLGFVRSRRDLLEYVEVYHLALQDEIANIYYVDMRNHLVLGSQL